jgi:hypothetical protein
MSAKMTRSHFQLIADVIAESTLDPIAKADIALNFANRLHTTNSAFDETKFLKACGVTGDDGAVNCEWADEEIAV